MFSAGAGVFSPGAGVFFAGAGPEPEVKNPEFAQLYALVTIITRSHMLSIEKLKVLQTLLLTPLHHRSPGTELFLLLASFFPGFSGW